MPDLGIGTPAPFGALPRARLDPLSNFVADLSWGPGLWKEVENLKSLFAKNVSPVCAKRVGAHERRHRGRGRTARKWGVSEELVAHSLIEVVGLSEGFWVGGPPPTGFTQIPGGGTAYGR